MKLLITAAGTVRAFFTEQIDLAKLGRVSMKRASSIEWCEEDQEWQVKGLPGGWILFSHKSRAECLTWEQKNLQVF